MVEVQGLEQGVARLFPAGPQVGQQSRHCGAITPLLARMAEFEQEAIIGRLAPTAYAFYGFQWQSLAFLDTAIAPIAQKLRLEGVETVLLTPA